jgi:hypothetical protein
MRTRQQILDKIAELEVRCSGEKRRWAIIAWQNQIAALRWALGEGEYSDV